MLVVAVVSDRAVVVVAELLDDLAVVPVVDGLAVVVVVDDLRVVEVDAEDAVVRVVEVDDEVLVDDELDAVVDEGDEDAGGASVIWMLRCPSSDSELPSLTTKLKPSTSTPEGAW